MEEGLEDSVDYTRCEFSHQNQFRALGMDGCDEEDEEDEQCVAPSGTGKGVEGVDLFPTIWMKWTRPAREEQVCLQGTIWKKWTRTTNVVDGWIPLKKTRVPRSRRRTGRRQARHRNRRRRETKRRRRSLRRKRLYRRGSVLGRRRRRVWLRGGASPVETAKQVCVASFVRIASVFVRHMGVSVKVTATTTTTTTLRPFYVLSQPGSSSKAIIQGQKTEGSG